MEKTTKKTFKNGGKILSDFYEKMKPITLADRLFVKNVKSFNQDKCTFEVLVASFYFTTYNYVKQDKISKNQKKTKQNEQQ